MQIGYDQYDSPIGPIWVVVDSVGVKKIAMSEAEWETDQNELGEIRKDPVRCAPVIRQLDEYFRGVRQTFDLPLSISGTPFRQTVWRALQTIPYGQVCSYQEIAAQIGKPKAVRAVGQANRANPLPVLIPCHRVIGKRGDLVGYAGNRTEIKAFLLRLEGALE
jgi:methylated-DNA-[protein]-cysteine S-methyltransferase